jgi:hypothetical protein
MKFTLEEIVQGSKSKFEKELKEFKDVLRTPIGIIVKGNDFTSLKCEYVKFLIEIKSPLPIILVLKNAKTYEGTIYLF